MKVKESQENILIQKIRAACVRTHDLNTMIGVGDDAAAVFGSPRPKLFCSDFTLEGRHWRRDMMTPADVAHKSLARALSDIAAMGGRPLGITVSMALSSSMSAAECESFIDSYYETAADVSLLFQAPLVGGDLSRFAGPIAIDVAVIGELFDHSPPWRRNEARPHDLAFVTGPLGGAAWALAEPESASPDCQRRLKRPVPRLDIARSMHGHTVNAAIDISDGLLMDAKRLCEESSMRLEIDPRKLPAHPDLKKHPRALDFALTHGDDYELLLAIPESWARTEFGQKVLAENGLIEIGCFRSVTDATQPTVQVLGTSYSTDSTHTGHDSMESST